GQWMTTRLFSFATTNAGFRRHREPFAKIKTGGPLKIKINYTFILKTHTHEKNLHSLSPDWSCPNRQGNTWHTRQHGSGQCIPGTIPERYHYLSSRYA